MMAGVGARARQISFARKHLVPRAEETCRNHEGAPPAALFQRLRLHFIMTRAGVLHHVAEKGVPFGTHLPRRRDTEACRGGRRQVFALGLPLAGSFSSFPTESPASKLENARRKRVATSSSLSLSLPRNRTIFQATFAQSSEGVKARDRDSYKSDQTSNEMRSIIFSVYLIFSSNI